MTEPIAWMVYTEDGKSVYVTDNPTDIKEDQRALPLYTKQEWQGLTDDEVNEVYAAGDAYRIRIVRLIEAKLKEKNT